MSTRTGAYCIGEDRVDESYRRRVGVSAVGVALVVEALLEVFEEHRDVGGVLRQRPGTGEQVAQLALRRDDDLEIRDAAVHLHVVERDDVGRVGARDRDLAGVRTADRHDEMAFGEASRHESRHAGIDGDGGEVDRFERQGGGERGRDLTLAGEAELGDERAEAHPAAFAVGDLLRFEGVVELLGRDRALLDQHLTEPTAGSRRCRGSAHLVSIGDCRARSNSHFGCGQDAIGGSSSLVRGPSSSSRRWSSPRR